MTKDKIKSILKIVADKYSVKPSQILSDTKTREVSRVRRIVMWKLRQYGYSTSYIGKLLNKDHSTVVLGCQKVESNSELLKEANSINIGDLSLLEQRHEEPKKDRLTYLRNSKWGKIFGEYKAVCQVCGFEDVVEIHHIIPLKNGGSNFAENIMILCSNHHKMLHLGMLHISKINQKELLKAE